MGGRRLNVIHAGRQGGSVIILSYRTWAIIHVHVHMYIVHVQCISFTHSSQGT